MRLSCLGCEKINGRHFTHFKSKNYSSVELGEIIAKNMAKNSKKTTRRATSAMWRIFAELDKPKHTLSKMNLTLMQISMF